ncbi:MAG: hypothetical protein LBG64_00445 [Pseudomonadales bacterium]|jgi:hypothetical protein|nr:hypothetical protein [Pseudomonadales bacterium]
MKFDTVVAVILFFSLSANIYYAVMRQTPTSYLAAAAFLFLMIVFGWCLYKRRNEKRDKN